MTSRLEWLTIDSHDPRGLADFWCAVLGYVVYSDDGAKVEIGPDPEVPDRERLDRLHSGADVPSIGFVRVPDAKVTKNRLHFEIAPIDSDQDTELARLIGLGASRADVGAGSDRSWIVLADPEGNEFCLVRSLAPDVFTL